MLLAILLQSEYFNCAFKFNKTTAFCESWKLIMNFFEQYYKIAFDYSCSSNE